MLGKGYISEQKKIHALVGGYVVHQSSIKNNLGFCMFMFLLF